MQLTTGQRRLLNQLRAGYTLIIYKRRTWLLTSPDGKETTRPRADLCRGLVTNLCIEETISTNGITHFRVTNLGDYATPDTRTVLGKNTH